MAFPKILCYKDSNPGLSLFPKPRHLPCLIASPNYSPTAELRVYLLNHKPRLPLRGGEITGSQVGGGRASKPKDAGPGREGAEGGWGGHRSPQGQWCCLFGQWPGELMKAWD